MQKIKALLSYDKEEFFNNPPNFDTPPLDFEEKSVEDGWSVIAKTILSK